MISLWSEELVSVLWTDSVDAGHAASQVFLISPFSVRECVLLGDRPGCHLPFASSFHLPVSLMLSSLPWSYAPQKEGLIWKRKIMDNERIRLFGFQPWQQPFTCLTLLQSLFCFFLLSPDTLVFISLHESKTLLLNYLCSLTNFLFLCVFLFTVLFFIHVRFYKPLHNMLYADMQSCGPCFLPPPSAGGGQISGMAGQIVLGGTTSWSCSWG